jgi:hypothetical protein
MGLLDSDAIFVLFIINWTIVIVIFMYGIGISTMIVQNLGVLKKHLYISPEDLRTLWVYSGYFGGLFIMMMLLEAVQQFLHRDVAFAIQAFRAGFLLVFLRLTHLWYSVVRDNIMIKEAE